MNDVSGSEDLSDDVTEVPEELAVTNTVFNQIAQQEKSVNFSKVAGGVFSDMEKDIRGESFDLDDDEDENETISEEDFDVDSAFEEDDNASASKASDNLEDDDDVQNVYHNWDMPEEPEED